MKYSLLLLLSMMVTGYSSPQGDPAVMTRRSGPPNAQIQTRFEVALSSLERGEISLALDSFNGLAVDASNIWVRVGIAACKLRLGDYENAAKEFRSVSREADSPSSALTGLGVALLNLGEIHQAVEAFEASSNRSKSSNSRFLLAYALCLDNQIDRAQTECERAMHLLPNGPVGSFSDEVRGVVAFLRGDDEEAIEQFRAVLSEPVSSGLMSHSQVSVVNNLVLQRRTANRSVGPVIRRREEPPPIERRNADAVAQDTPSGPVVRNFGGEVIRVSGVVPVSATLQQVEGVRFVAFLVDGNQRFLTNTRPFHWDWDTTRERDGIHRLCLHAYGGGKNLLQVDEFTVEIRNGLSSRPSPQGSAPITFSPPDAAETYNSRFERVFGLQPNLLRARYLLAHVYQEKGRNDFAAEELTSIFLENPGYLGVRERLLTLRSQLTGAFKPASLPEVRSVFRTDKVIGLTFDDGPRPFYTPRVLEILRENGIHATFFLVGKMVDAYPQLARDIVADGHELANHSYSHQNMATLSLIESEQDVLRCERAIRNATGLHVTRFRPPGGHYGPELKQALANFGYSTIFWTANITSYPDRSPDEIAESLAADATGGGIILLHNGQDQTVHVLPMLLEILRRRGFRCVPISQLFERPQ